MDDKLIMMGIIVFILTSIYLATLWTEKNNKKLKKELKQKGILL